MKSERKLSLMPVWIGVSLSLIVSATAIVLYLKKPENSIVYFDAIRLLSNYKGVNDMKRELELKSQDLKIKLDTLEHELQQLTESSGRDKKEMQARIRLKQEQFVTYKQYVEEKYRNDQKQMQDEMLKDVNVLIGNYCKSRGYEIVLAGTQLGNIAYGNDRLDITDELLTVINNNYGRK
jgi:outer membrane protein